LMTSWAERFTKRANHGIKEIALSDELDTLKRVSERLVMHTRQSRQQANRGYIFK